MAAAGPGWIFAICLILSASYAFGSEIDRLLVAVNGKAITEGDLNVARGLNAVIFYDKNAQPSSRDEEISRLVDLELMRQELKNFRVTHGDEGKVQARLQSLREVYAQKGGLSILLQKLGIDESELIAYLQFESSMTSFVDFQFRPFVKVSEEEIKKYYAERLTEQLRKAKVNLPPLAQVADRIEEILREEKINVLLDQWIKDIRRSSRIEHFDRPVDFEGTSTGSPEK